MVCRFHGTSTYGHVGLWSHSRLVRRSNVHTLCIWWWARWKIYIWVGLMFSKWIIYEAYLCSELRLIGRRCRVLLVCREFPTNLTFNLRVPIPLTDEVPQRCKLEEGGRVANIGKVFIMSIGSTRCSWVFADLKICYLPISYLFQVRGSKNTFSKLLRQLRMRP